MFGSRKLAKFSSLRLQGHPQVIEYAHSVLDQMMEEVLQGFHQFGRGGLAVGGVLFGTGDRHLVRILAARAFECDHSSGPSYTLSEADHERMRLFLEDAKEDPELSELTPVGWYHSHTRAGLTFTPSDQVVHQEHFPEPWNIALIFRPEHDRPMSAGVFIRQDDGSIPTHPALLIDDPRTAGAEAVKGSETETPPPEVPQEMSAEEPAGVSREAGLDDRGSEPENDAEPRDQMEGPPEENQSPVTVPTAEEDVPEIFSSYAVQPPKDGKRWNKKWIGLAAAMALIAGGVAAAWQWAPPEYWTAVREQSAQAGEYLVAVGQYWRQKLRGQSARTLSLRALASGSNLLIRWDAMSPAMSGAVRGVLEISDSGRRSEEHLDTDQLVEGAFPYQRVTGDVQVRLTVHRAMGEPLVETTRFVGQPPFQGGGGTAAIQTTDELRAELERLRTALLRQTEQTRAYEGTLRALRELEHTRNLSGGGAAPPRTPRPAPGPPRPVLSQKAPVGAAAPPVLRQTSPEGTSASSAVRQTPTAAGPRGGSSGPTAGKLIWTGFLPEGELLTINEGVPSTGRLSGALPSKPVQIAVFPAELSGTGLMIFSGRSSDSGKTEEPSPRNSWNRTTYHYDAELARTVTLVESPNEQNNWNRLAVRATGRSLSVVVIEWKLVR